MEITEPGYYWYQSGNINKVVVQVVKNKNDKAFYVWFFGSEYEMFLSVAEKRGKFLKKIEDYTEGE